jgi:CO/xanthine dehydrogenase Mo-binding subunit
VVEVDIDPLTYQPKVIDNWAVFDIGTPIDDRIVQGQIEGGFMQGLGYACMEDLIITQGKVLQDSFSTYMIPTSKDFPRLHIQLIDNPSPDGPFGAKGLGELPLVGVGPAYVSAIQNAIGHELTELPVTPERIMEAIAHET